MNRLIQRSTTRLLTTLIVPALIAIGCSAHPAYAADLSGILHQAQQNDPTYDSARYALEMVRERIPQARAGLLPTASINGSKGPTRADTEFTDVDPVERTMKSWSWSLQLAQPLIRFGNVFAYRESESLGEQAEAQFALAREDLLIRVAQTYFAVIVAQDAIDAAKSQVDALEEQLAQVKRGYALGTHSITDIDETQSRLGLARSQQVAAQNDWESKQADLEKITGERPMTLAQLQPAINLPPPEPNDVRLWMDQARSHHPQVIAQQAALRAAQEVIRKNRSEYLPTLDLVGSYGSNYASNSLTTPNDFSTRAKSRQVGLQLAVPLFAGGGTSAKVSEAIAGMNKAKADTEIASRQAATDAQQAYAGVINGLAQIDALNAALTSAQSALKGNQIGYKNGIRINLDVLNAQQQRYTAQRDLTKARYDTVLQGLKLKMAAGALTDDDLMAVNAMLQH